MISVALLLFSGLGLALLHCNIVAEWSLSIAGFIAAPRTPLRLCCLYSPLRPSLSRLYPPLTFPPLLSTPPSLPSPHSSLPPSSLPLPPSRPNRSVRLRQGFALRETSGLHRGLRPLTGLWRPTIWNIDLI